MDCLTLFHRSLRFWCFLLVLFCLVVSWLFFSISVWIGSKIPNHFFQWCLLFSFFPFQILYFSDLVFPFDSFLWFPFLFVSSPHLPSHSLCTSCFWNSNLNCYRSLYLHFLLWPMHENDLFVLCVSLSLPPVDYKTRTTASPGNKVRRENTVWNKRLLNRKTVLWKK